jgi:ADP-ribosyl-[dinitrogen reductase] hydrolase
MPFDPLHLHRCLIGTCLGDSLGLSFENLPPQAVQAMTPLPLRQRMLFGHGLLSDDSLHAVFTVQSFFESDQDPEKFKKALARRLRNWFLCVPPGVGLSTARACMKLCVSVSPSKSAINSAGNGPMMRSAVLGCLFADDDDARSRCVDASTLITHRHPLAIAGARIVAAGAALACHGDLQSWRQAARAVAPDWPFDTPQPTSGPSGFIVHSVNAVIACVEQSRSLDETLSRAITLGGDTDSIAAVAGAIAAVLHGVPALDPSLTRWIGWPSASELSDISSGNTRSVPWVRVLAAHLAALPAIPLCISERSIARIRAAR